MPQPQGDELEKVRARRNELRAEYLRPAAQRPATVVQGVHHLALICKDVEATIKFYQEFLGFPLGRAGGEPGLRWVEPFFLRYRQPKPARILRLSRPRSSGIQ
ncbi:VOC family protein [Fodinicola feengrottensis]|uniref:VOC family protein n=1 Tax=Fodinicola feengrottensis TaxID=435914 RepID=UPI0024411797|nr:VOC family protein [Fodinicola feengrottensis]